MNSRVLLCAIAGIDEAYVRESEQFSAIATEIKADRKRMRQRLTAVGIAAALTLAVFGAIRLVPSASRLFVPPESTSVRSPDATSASESVRMYTEPGTVTGKDDVPTPGETASGVVSTTEPTKNTGEEPAPPAPAGHTDRREPGTEKPVTERPSTTKAPVAEPSATATAPNEPSAEPPTEPTTADPPQPQTETPTEPSTEDEPGGTPGGVFTKLNVGYDEAREWFAHPIVPCYDDGFTGYRVGVVSRDGNINANGAVCLSVDYVFANGYIDLLDQDRMTGSVASGQGTEYNYRGRTFYVQTPDDEGNLGSDHIQIGYYPSGDSGVAYQAIFNEGADVYEIMDLMISFEI